jgi:hypothetical protein
MAVVVVNALHVMLFLAAAILTIVMLYMSEEQGTIAENEI